MTTILKLFAALLFLAASVALNLINQPLSSISPSIIFAAIIIAGAIEEQSKR